MNHFFTVLCLSVICTNASTLSISIRPTTNTVNAYYFPNREAAEGQVIHIRNGMTVCYEFLNTNRIVSTPDAGDVMSFRAVRGNASASFNMYHSSYSSVKPNLHDAGSQMVFTYQSLNVPNFTNRVWHSVSASFLVTSETYPKHYVFGCLDGTNYSDSVLDSRRSIFPILTNIDVTITLTNTLTSWIPNWGNYEIRNIWVFDTCYTNLPLSLICQKNKETLDFSKEVVLTCSQLATNYPATNPYKLYFSTNLIDWHYTAGLLYVRTNYLTGAPKTATVVLPYFNEPMNLFRIYGASGPQ